MRLQVRQHVQHGQLYQFVQQTHLLQPVHLVHVVQQCRLARTMQHVQLIQLSQHLHLAQHSQQMERVVLRKLQWAVSQRWQCAVLRRMPRVGVQQVQGALLPRIQVKQLLLFVQCGPVRLPQFVQCARIAQLVGQRKYEHRMQRAPLLVCYRVRQRCAEQSNQHQVDTGQGSQARQSVQLDVTRNLLQVMERLHLWFVRNVPGQGLRPPVQHVQLMPHAWVEQRMQPVLRSVQQTQLFQHVHLAHFVQHAVAVGEAYATCASYAVNAAPGPNTVCDASTTRAA